MKKLVERDIDPLSSPSETVRLHLLQKIYMVLTPDNIYESRPEPKAFIRSNLFFLIQVAVLLS